MPPSLRNLPSVEMVDLISHLERVTPTNETLDYYFLIMVVGGISTGIILLIIVRKCLCSKVRRLSRWKTQEVLTLTSVVKDKSEDRNPHESIVNEVVRVESQPIHGCSSGAPISAVDEPEDQLSPKQ